MVPSLCVAAAVVLALYSGRGYPVGALLATAGAFIANNLAELPLGQLYRDLRFRLVALPTLVSKVGAVAVFVPGAPVTVALLVGAVLNLALFEVLAGKQAPLRLLWRDRPSLAAARRAFRSGRGLYAYTLAELLALRVPALGLSLVVPLTVMGIFGTVATAFQAVLTVLQSGLNMVLSLRARAGGGRQHRRFDAEALSIGAGLLAAAVIEIAAPRLTSGVLALPEPEAATWLRVLGLALPFFLVNRIAATHAIADGHHTRAARIAACLAVCTTVALVVATPLAGVTGGALATLIGEAAVALGLLGLRIGRATVR